MQGEKFQGVLVTNAFLRTHKFVEHYEWLKEAAEHYDIELELLSNTDLLYRIDNNSLEESRDIDFHPMDASALAEASDMNHRMAELVRNNDFVLYWDKDIPLGKLLESFCRKSHVPVFNSLEAIAVCDNKYETYYRLWEWNQTCLPQERIPILPSIPAPMTYDNIGYTDTAFLKRVVDSLGLPLIIKECYGSFGMQVYLADTFEKAADVTKKLAGKPFLYQKYQKESRGQDVRLQVVGDEVVAAMYRFSDTDFRANISNGGSMKPYEPTKKECDLAVRTVRALGLDFGGVDLLFSGEEADIVCEVNSNAHFKNIYTCTGVNTAECIMKYIRQKMER